MKRFLSILLAVLMLLCACAHAETASEGLEFEYDDYLDGYELVGRGTCTDEIVVIPNEYEGEPVVSIFYHAFEEDHTLKQVILQETLKALTTEPIVGCVNLEYYEEDNVRYLSSASNPRMLMFRLRDEEAVEFTVPSETKLIREHAFAGITTLERVTLPEGLIFLGGNAFKGCTALKELTIPAGIEMLYARTFMDCTSLEKVTMQSGVWFGEYTFSGCSSLKEITLQPGFAMSIPTCESVFKGCTALTDIHFGGTQSQFFRDVYGDLSVERTVTVHCTDGDFQIEPLAEE